MKARPNAMTLQRASKGHCFKVTLTRKYAGAKVFRGTIKPTEVWAYYVHRESNEKGSATHVAISLPTEHPSERDLGRLTPAGIFTHLNPALDFVPGKTRPPSKLAKKSATLTGETLLVHSSHAENLISTGEFERLVKQAGLRRVETQ